MTDFPGSPGLAVAVGCIHRYMRLDRILSMEELADEGPLSVVSFHLSCESGDVPVIWNLYICPSFQEG